ncbi:hypothetical protein HHK36_029675 [Tetracentron sinense]|uniref:Peptidase M10 metallopeptidase domain-containing protein n=1 Tax=Tetracentron sinense TaxID=13715 RepID=A0A834YA04_TETSI|nr:hypothetical protein HHK36_029675 [Tetracentron sinense]
METDHDPFDGPSGISAHAYTPTSGKFHFDADENWGTYASPGIMDLKSVVVHNIGHLLGLEHNSVRDVEMYPTLYVEVAKSYKKPNTTSLILYLSCQKEDVAVATHFSLRKSRNLIGKRLSMEGNGSYGTSWADQWDYSNPDLVTEQNSTGGATSKYKKKLGEGFGKTKSVASTGMRKMKVGTSSGFQWIKDKYHKRTQKH